MAKKVTVTLVDDFDGAGPADETVEFSIDGVSYEIDLSASNAQKLRDEFKPWIDAGRRVGGRRRGRPTGAATNGRGRAVIDREQSAAIRSGPGTTVTRCPPAAGFPPTSSRPSTPPPDLGVIRAVSLRAKHPASESGNKRHPSGVDMLCSPVGGLWDPGSVDGYVRRANASGEPPH